MTLKTSREGISQSFFLAASGLPLAQSQQRRG